MFAIEYVLAPDGAAVQKATYPGSTLRGAIEKGGTTVGDVARAWSATDSRPIIGFLIRDNAGNIVHRSYMPARG